LFKEENKPNCPAFGSKRTTFFETAGSFRAVTILSPAERRADKLTLARDTSFAYAVGRIRALETRLLDRSKLERMIDAASADEAIKILAETDYGSAVAELAAVHDFEEILQREMALTLAELEKMSPQKDLIALMRLRYDVLNLKILLKAKYLQVKAELLLPLGTVPLSTLQAMVDEERFRDLPGPLRSALDRIMEEFPLTRDPQMIDLALDRVLFEQLMAEAARLQSPFLKGLFARQIDLINLKTFIRVKRMERDRDFFKKAVLPGGRLPLDRLISLFDEPLDALHGQLSRTDYATLIEEGVRGWMEKGSSALLEKLADDYITTYLQRGKRSAFGPEPLIGYLWAKEIEVKNIRLILVGKINKLSADAIRERLRDVYL
jgi:V/A-type H+-transporting ATPase subunit C